MNGTSMSIPFRLPEIYHGLAEGHGRLHVGEEGLRLEFRVKDAVFGVLKSRVKEVFIPYADIESFELKIGWFRRRLFIHTRSLQLVEDFPGDDDGCIILNVRKSPKDRIREIHSHITLHMSEQKLREIDSWPDSL
jgi:hypothetical protein